MLTSAFMQLFSECKLQASLPLCETALKYLEASENGFKQTLLEWRDYPFLQDLIRVSLKHCAADVVSPQADK